MATPLVSVLMTAYNREKYIAEAIESVLNSSYYNFELIIVDDASRDNTVDIALKFKAKDNRIRVYKNKRNLGDYPNRNKAASYARGKYLKYLDSDDKIESWGLEYCVNEMEKYPTAGLALAYYGDLYNRANLLSPSTIIDEHFNKASLLNIGPTGSIYRNDVFRKLKGFDTKFGVASDNYFNIKVASTEPILLLRNDFFFYRDHDGQEKKNEKEYIINGYNYLKELMVEDSLPINKSNLIYHQKKLEKRLAVNIAKFIYRNPSYSNVIEIIKRTDSNFLDLLRSLLK